MNTRPIPHRFAGAATAAVLALSATAAFAQEAVPAADPVATSPPAATAPSVVAEPVASQPAPTMTSQTAETAPAAAPSAKPAARARATASVPAASTSARPAARAASAAPVAPVAVAPFLAPIAEPAPVIVPQPEPLPSVDPAAPADVPADNGLALAGLAGLLALGGASLFALTRRRRRVAGEAEAIYEDTYSPEPLASETVVEPETGSLIPATIEPAEVAAPEPAPEPAYAYYADRDESEPVTSEPVEADTFTEELDRMTAAEPDEANPFVSPKRRRKRARALLNQRNREQEAAPEAKPAFDWNSLRPAQNSAEPKKIEYA